MTLRARRKREFCKIYFLLFFLSQIDELAVNSYYSYQRKQSYLENPREKLEDVVFLERESFYSEEMRDF
jgi:hypothetical protein